MTLKSAPNDMTPVDRAVFGYGRVRNAAYEAVQALWRRRKSEGLTQLQLGERIGRDPARVSKYLRGPGNWTLRTFGELVEALDGEAEIIIHAIRRPSSRFSEL
jgi:transcriptional regulator with XRE-family HTH domain